MDVLEHILMNLLRLYAIGGTRFLLQLNGRQYGPIVAGMSQPWCPMAVMAILNVSLWILMNQLKPWDVASLNWILINPFSMIDPYESAQEFAVDEAKKNRFPGPCIVFVVSLLQCGSWCPRDCRDLEVWGGGAECRILHGCCQSSGDRKHVIRYPFRPFVEIRFCRMCTGTGVPSK